MIMYFTKQFGTMKYILLFSVACVPAIWVAKYFVTIYLV